MALYQTIRPKKFDELVGNAATIKALKKIVKQDPADRPHAFLFSGNTGCGKTTLARILAKEFGCSDIDLAEYNIGNTRGIDTIREVIQDAAISPMAGECRVFIFDEAHQFTKDAQNSLLKLIEDYPPDSYFIFCSTDPHKIIKTVRNRCSQFVVDTLKFDDAEILLGQTLDKLQNDLASDEVFDAIIEASDGSARTLLTILESVLSVDTEKEQLSLIQKANIEHEVIDICRALINSKQTIGDWKKICEIYKGIADNDAETIRRSILGYMKTVLLSGTKNAGLAFDIIKIMSKPTYDSGHPLLLALLYEATFA